jgi:2,3-bisphosphoglycerate-dependent phosphoglycerate mutase
MKIVVSFLLGLFLFTLTATNLFAQNKKMTIILLRHAEKDVSIGADKTDPDLSAEGKLRAERLVKEIKKYKPGAVYSSNFKRTKLTAAPVAEKRKLQVQTYDHKNLDTLVNQLMTSKIKRIVVVGHNTTTPALANLLIKQEKYKALDESEYSKIWIIKIKKGKVIEEKVIEY